MPKADGYAISELDMRYLQYAAAKLANANTGYLQDLAELVSDGHLALLRADRLWRERPELRERFHVRGRFLRGVLRHEMIEGIRARGGRIADDAHLEDMPFKFTSYVCALPLHEPVRDGSGEARGDTLGSILPGETRESLFEEMDVIRRLPERERLVFFRHVFVKDTLPEIGADMGFSSGRASAIFTSACRHLRQLLHGREIQPEDVRIVALAFSREPSARNATAAAHAERLSEREDAVLALIAAGDANPEIAHKLFISEETVKSHTRQILAKLQARNRAHAVARGYQLGWLAVETKQTDAA